MHMSRVLASVTLGAVLCSFVPAAAAPSQFLRLAEHYETIRQALLHDRMAGVQESAEAMQLMAHRLETAFDPEVAGVASQDATRCKELLPEINIAAKRVAQAEDIASARDAFADLSVAMVHYRQMATGQRPEVAYCSMAKRSWLQPDGEIGNPYFGQAMPRCGTLVSP